MRLSLFVVVVVLGGCHRSTPPAHAAAPVLATVNGVPITDADVLVKLKNDSHVGELRPEYKKNVLDALIRDELILQRGLELGLDADPSYAEPVRQLEAQLAALKRHRMADLYFRHEIAAKLAVTEADVQRYFDASKVRFGSELHVLQIFKRARGPIDEAKRALEGGQAFEAVAQGGFPGLSPEQKPWDLGWLKWGQLPVEWRDALGKMSPGEISAVLTGTKDRFWIVKLVEVRHVEPSFESEKAAIVELMKGEQLAKLRAEAERGLRERARVTVMP
jgi:parvulin-like peptidyl-prolyl isomerase